MEVSAEPGLEVSQAAAGLAAAERGIEGSGESKLLIGMVQKETRGTDCKGAGGTSSLCLEAGGKWSGWVKTGVWGRGDDGGKGGQLSCTSLIASIFFSEVGGKTIC